MIKLSDILVKNKETGKKYDVKKPDPSKHEFTWDYRGSKENPNPFVKKKSVKKEEVEDHSNDRDMVVGVAEIVRMVKDMDNRKEIANSMVNKFNKENVKYNKDEFMKMAGISESLSEMGVNDIHFKQIMKIYTRGGNLKKKISDFLFPGKPVQSSAVIAKELRSMDYDDVKELEDKLRIDIHKF